ncbi:MAG TPA: ABC transporter permease [Terriglobales bacterium]|jgi:putative ABC transport system permease protein|nr:ABC transporter permease [Terriglobales bacterium]
MNLREIAKQTLGTLRAHKMRSFLTMFGIVWGIASVIILVGLGLGFSKDQKKRMETLGKDLVIMWGGRTSAQIGGLAAGRKITLTIDDARLIRNECYLVKLVSPELQRNVPEVSPYNSAARQVSGVWPSFQSFRSLILSEGRLMTKEDEDNQNRVVILGWNAARQLYPGQPAIGTTLIIARYPYTVIGVLAEKKQNSNYSGPDNDMLYVPYSSMARDFPPPPAKGEPIIKGYLSDIVMEVSNPEEHEKAVMQVRRTLGRLHHFEPTDKDALFIWDTMQGSKILARIFGVITIFFGCVAVVTLGLGGIGVMNIMLVAVTERTREIGILRAVGATKADILNQFFAESAVITVLSGLLGYLFGVGICVVMAHVPLPDIVPAPIVSPAAVITSLITLSFITVSAGMYPARRAAEMDPVECLRYE